MQSLLFELKKLYKKKTFLLLLLCALMIVWGNAYYVRDSSNQRIEKRLKTHVPFFTATSEAAERFRRNKDFQTEYPDAYRLLQDIQLEELELFRILYHEEWDTLPKSEYEYFLKLDSGITLGVLQIERPYLRKHLIETEYLWRHHLPYEDTHLSLQPDLFFMRNARIAFGPMGLFLLILLLGGHCAGELETGSYIYLYTLPVARKKWILWKFLSLLLCAVFFVLCILLFSLSVSFLTGHFQSGFPYTIFRGDLSGSFTGVFRVSDFFFPVIMNFLVLFALFASLSLLISSHIRHSLYTLLFLALIMVVSTTLSTSLSSQHVLDPIYSLQFEFSLLEAAGAVGYVRAMMHLLGRLILWMLCTAASLFFAAHFFTRIKESKTSVKKESLSSARKGLFFFEIHRHLTRIGKTIPALVSLICLFALLLHSLSLMQRARFLEEQREALIVAQSSIERLKRNEEHITELKRLLETGEVKPFQKRDIEGDIRTHEENYAAYVRIRNMHRNIYEGFLRGDSKMYYLSQRSWLRTYYFDKKYGNIMLGDPQHPEFDSHHLSLKGAQISMEWLKAMQEQGITPSAESPLKTGKEDTFRTALSATRWHMRHWDFRTSGVHFLYTATALFFLPVCLIFLLLLLFSEREEKQIRLYLLAPKKRSRVFLLRSFTKLLLLLAVYLLLLLLFFGTGMLLGGVGECHYPIPIEGENISFIPMGEIIAKGLQWSVALFIFLHFLLELLGTMFKQKGAQWVSFAVIIGLGVALSFAFPSWCEWNPFSYLSLHTMALAGVHAAKGGGVLLIGSLVCMLLGSYSFSERGGCA